ncbi:MAG: radical SAM protein [Polyangiaceae bacterium]
MSPPQDGHHLLARIAGDANVPSGAHLQIADRCNHACVHCYQVQGRKGEMDTATILSVIDELAATGVFVLNVSGGEATLRPDLVPVLRHARSRGFAIRLFTNGYTMTEPLARELATIGLLAVEVSVYSDEPSAHDRVTRVPGSHARTLQGVRALVDAGLRVHLKVPATSIVPDAASRVRRLADRLNATIADPRLHVIVVSSVEITPAETGDLAPHELAPDPHELARLGELGPARLPEDRDAARAATRREAPCGACKQSVTVLANGDLRPCTDIVAPLGNVTERPFAELYASPEAAFVKSITWDDVHGCRDCDLLPGCQRCHASASLESGDLLGPYPSACASARARYGLAVGTLVVTDGEGVPAGRTTGPYRIVVAGRLETAVDEVSSEDEARRVRFPWVRPTRPYFEAMSHGEAAAKRRRPLLASTAVVAHDVRDGGGPP